METYVKIQIEQENRYTYIPCSRIRLVNFNTGDGTIYCMMNTTNGDISYSMTLVDSDDNEITTDAQAQSVLDEFAKIISSNPGGGVVSLGGEFNRLIEPPEFTQI
tara:strand:+ start:974 stop:1288 length:315 start_codon:yes stop_codon:yes gene_type:complete